MKALIVEDNLELARYIRNGLCRSGFTCAIAAEGPTALQDAAGIVQRNAFAARRKYRRRPKDRSSKPRALHYSALPSVRLTGATWFVVRRMS